ncbi:MAG TPA: hypothetical protein VMV80_06640 [Anaerolineales bacterium]|nr:hypothetical protein [Anaerolineales bacterium]
MAITYNGDLSTDLDKVRFYINDVTDSAGPQPASGNFTDDELGGLITTEGSWQRAVAGAFEVLSGMWSKYVDTTEGPRSERMSQTATQYKDLAVEWRSKYGASVTQAGTRHPTRIDGYSQDVASDTVS